LESLVNGIPLVTVFQFLPERCCLYVCHALDINRFEKLLMIPNPNQALRRAIASQKNGDLLEAENLYRSILRVEPAHPDANHNLGLIEASGNKIEEALRLFKTALDANPKVEQFWFSYIDALIKENLLDEAKKVVSNAKEAELSDSALNLFIQQIDDQILHPTPRQSELDILLNDYKNGSHGVVEKRALSITKDFPNHPFAWKVLSALFLDLGRDKDSLSANLKVLELAPKDAEAHNNLGSILNRMGRLEEAEASCKRAIELRPDFAEAHSNLGNTLNALGRFAEAEASCRQAINLNPESADAHNNLGVVLHESGKFTEAVTSFERTVLLKPQYIEGHNNLGNSLIKLNRLEEAEFSFDQALQLKPDYKPALASRGKVSLTRGKFQAALRDLDLCDGLETKVDALIALYSLKRIDEVFARMELLSEAEARNMRMAAFASFISSRESRPTAHSFCMEPLELVHVGNLASYIRDSSSFISQILKALQDIKSVWEPKNKATNNGFQSIGNIFEYPSKVITALREIVVSELDSYRHKFGHKSCLYIKEWPSRKVLSGWYVNLKKQGYQSPHIHESGWLSGVIYLQTVPSLGKDEGAIEFSLNGEHYFDEHSPQILHQPEPGDIVLFPSSLHHRTIPFTTDLDRIVISFDLTPDYME